MPKGKNLGARDYEDFKNSREDVIRQANVNNYSDTLFAPVTERIMEQCTSFDVIFCREGTNVDTDILEISSLEKSLVKQLEERERKIRLPLEEKIGSKLFIINSLLNILGDLNTSKITSHKKYQSHLYRILPKIYTGTYYNDPILLPAFIEKVEYKVRNEDAKNLGFHVRQLKYDFYFLAYIQNSKKEGENLMKIQETISYKIGSLLGQLAKQFAAWREDCPMKSFEKSYVGTLSRRITNIQDLIKFKTLIEEKLIMHERVSYTHSISAELAETIIKLEGSSEKYDKNNCAFGFFESYFTKEEKQNKTDGGEIQ